MNLFLVYQYREGVNGDPSEFQGVFSSFDKAVDACRNENYSVLPATLDESLPDEREENWEGQVWPLRRYDRPADLNPAIAEKMDRALEAYEASKSTD